MTINANTNYNWDASSNTLNSGLDIFSVLDVPMLDVESDPAADDLWFNQWASELSQLQAEDCSPRFCD